MGERYNLSYSYFAKYYDTLMENAEYEKRAEYFLKLFRKHGHNTGLTLDLACGTGTLTFKLYEKGVDIFGCDMSEDMLSIAQQKAYESEKNIMFICQKMQNLNLPGKIDTCICTLDSINHLTSAKEVQKTFDRVSKYLNDNGIFVFDVNTIYKHKYILGEKCYILDNCSGSSENEKVTDIFCTWQNDYYEKDHEVVITLNFFERIGKLYKRSTEQFSERAYSDSDIRKMAENAGFCVEAVYDDMSFKNLKEDSQRAVYVLMKRGNKYE